MIADLQLRIVDFTCTMSLLTGEKTHILTLEGDYGLVFDAVVSSATAERLLGAPEETPDPPRPEAVEHRAEDDEEQG